MEITELHGTKDDGKAVHWYTEATEHRLCRGTSEDKTMNRNFRSFLHI